MSSTDPVSNLDITTALGHTLVFEEGGALLLDGVAITAGVEGFTLTAAGTQVVTVSQTGTGAIHVTGNATGGIEIGGGTTTAIQVGTASTNKIGFFGTAPVVQPTAAGMTTVAEVVTFLQTLGLGS